MQQSDRRSLEKPNLVSESATEKIISALPMAALRARARAPKEDGNDEENHNCPRSPSQENDGSSKWAKSCSAPPITLSAHDHERLSRSASAAASTMPDMAATLMDELDRAHVLAKGRHPVDVVCMGSEVVYRDYTTGRIGR